MIKRFFTYFGVPIPPWKEEPQKRGGMTIFFVLTGKIPSKKNNQQAVTVRRFARKWAQDRQKLQPTPTWADVHKAISMCSSKMRGNADYLAFLEKTKPVLQHQSSFWSERLFDKGLIFPLQKSSLSLKLHWKDRTIRDTVNTQQTIQDLLKDCGIIADDNYRTLNPIKSESACYAEELIHNIAFISLFISPNP